MSVAARPVPAWPLLVLTWFAATTVAMVGLGVGEAPATAAVAALLTATAFVLRSMVAGPDRVVRYRVAARHALDHARSVGVLRSCDPDADGHARPRAPGA